MFMALALWTELGGATLTVLGFISMGVISGLRKQNKAVFAGPAPDGSDKVAIGELIHPGDLRKSRYRKFHDIMKEHRDSPDLTPAMQAALED